jgi:hypothetical protein
MRSAVLRSQEHECSAGADPHHTMDNLGIASPAIPSAVAERPNRNKLRRFIVVIDIWIPHFEIHARKLRVVGTRLGADSPARI